MGKYKYIVNCGGDWYAPEGLGEEELEAFNAGDMVIARYNLQTGAFESYTDEGTWISVPLP